MTAPTRLRKGCSPRLGLRTRNPLRLLLAIPDPTQSGCVSRRLQSLGHTILLEVRDGVTALDVSRRLHPHVILVAAELLNQERLDLAQTATRERIAPVVAILDLQTSPCVKQKAAPAQVGTQELEGTWGCIPACASELVLATAIQAAASLFAGQRTLEQAKETAEEQLRHRKLVEKAKGLLMASGRIGEQEAYRYLQKRSMDTGRPLWQVADAIILTGGGTHG